MLSTQKTTHIKPKAIKHAWWLVDLDGKILGRIATQIANILRGKHKPSYAPHLDNGDFVVVINASKVKLTGKKLEEKIYYRHSNYPGGLKASSAKELLKKHPEQLIVKAVKGMLPKNFLAQKILKKLKVYGGAEHPHTAQQPKEYGNNKG